MLKSFIGSSYCFINDDMLKTLEGFNSWQVQVFIKCFQQSFSLKVLRTVSFVSKRFLQYSKWFSLMRSLWLKASGCSSFLNSLLRSQLTYLVSVMLVILTTLRDFRTFFNLFFEKLMLFFFFQLNIIINLINRATTIVKIIVHGLIKGPDC